MGLLSFGGEIISTSANPQMKEAIRKSFAYNRQLLNGQQCSLKDLCGVQNLDLRHTRRILNLRFLAGDVLQKILTDRAPTHWTMGALFEAVSIAHPYGATFHFATPLQDKLPVRGGTSASVPQASTKTDWVEQRALLNR